MEVGDLASDLRQFGFDPLVGLLGAPLTAPAHEALGVLLEVGEEHACLSGLGILAHWKTASTGRRKPAQDSAFDQQWHEIADRPAIEATVDLGDEGFDSVGAQGGELDGEAGDERGDLLVFVIGCHTSWLGAAPCVVNIPYSRFGGSMPRPVIDRRCKGVPRSPTAHHRSTAPDNSTSRDIVEPMSSNTTAGGTFRECAPPAPVSRGHDIPSRRSPPARHRHSSG